MSFIQQLSSNLPYNLKNLQQQFQRAIMKRFGTDFSVQIPGLFVPFSQAQLSFIQLQPFRPLNMPPNEGLLNNKNPIQSTDGKGKWTFDQQKQYILFLHQNMEEMRQKASRKSNKVFLKMSLKVKTRNADQCRSHHQKIIKYHQSLEQIIRYYTEDVYSFEQIFGYRPLQINKSVENMKTGVEEGPREEIKLWVQRTTVKIQMNVDFIADY